MRLGLFGGTFNPVHLGHLRAGVEVQEAFDLDRLLLIPSAHPPHKTPHQVADARDRLEMVRLAVRNEPFLEVSDVECTRPGASYTIETLRSFQDALGRESEIFFIVGQDAFSEITTWKSYRSLFSTAHFIVMTRPGSGLNSFQDFIHRHVSGAYEYDPDADRYVHPDWYGIFCRSVTHMDISASQIRELVSRGRSIRFLTPDSVVDYILRKGLYR